jgi:diacylglycerol kinase (ATP)
MRTFLSRRVESFRCALRGIGFMLATETHARIHAVATAGAIALGLALELSSADWRWLVVALAVVWCAEAFNTALERLADVVSPGHHPGIGRAKDVAAGAVLIAALGAAAIGALVLGPPLWSAL